MRRHLRRMIGALAVCLAFHAATPLSSAGVAFVTNESTFHLLSGPLTTQTFGSAKVPLGGTFENEPLDSSTNDGIFKKGAILPGITFSSGSNQGLYILGPGDNTFFNGEANNANTAVTTNNFFDSLVINFTLPQNAVGLGILSTGGSDVEVDVYSKTNVLLGILIETPPISGSGQFLGLIGTLGDQIGSVVLSTPFSTAPLESVLVDRVQFTAIPEPSSLLMVAIGAGGMAGFRLHRPGKSRKSNRS